ncbi:MAG: DUF721 domain-containing protein [Spirochaetia bacterium]|nr:DUF721 domain-containing protein [Spirochaetia bacterium]
MIKKINKYDIDFFVNNLKTNIPESKVNQVKLDTAIINIKKNWPELIGYTLASHSMPVSLKGNCLFVTADHAIFAQQISLLQKEICEKISKGLLCPVNSIKTKTGQINWEDLKIFTEKSNIKMKDIMSLTNNMAPEREQQNENSNVLENLIQKLKKIT